MAEIRQPTAKGNAAAWSILSTALDKFVPGLGGVVSAQNSGKASAAGEVPTADAPQSQLPPPPQGRSFTENVQYQMTPGPDSMFASQQPTQPQQAVPQQSPMDRALMQRRKAMAANAGFE